MQRHKATYSISALQVEAIKHRMLNWANQFSILLFLDNNNYQSAYGSYECLLAVGATDIICCEDEDGLALLQQLHDKKRDWIFGHITYDYKNVIELRLKSTHITRQGFPQLQFFIPQTVLYINKEQDALTIESFEEPDVIYNTVILAYSLPEQQQPKLIFKQVIDKANYLAVIDYLRRHIADGDCYEINFCNEGYCENAVIDPLQVFDKLNKISPAPFAAFYKLSDKYMMCASPERYLRKEGDKLIAQPIKGTARRDKDPVIDEQIKTALRNDIKEQAENVMIVDLMRNDLARCCKTGCIQVEELFGIYSFPQVHQMISTIIGKIEENMAFTEAIRTSFPMGSMTGAPKYKVMQLIEQYERSKRELFSGTVGYITPNGDFDFNVVIRSLFYNADTSYLSYQTGGAITYDSDPEREWEEMRLKAWALEQIFS